MSAPPILLDVDEVLLDWIGGFSVYLAKLGHDRIRPINTWELEKAYSGLTAEDIRRYVCDFNASYSFMRLDPVPGAQFGVKELRRAFPESRIFAVSCYLSPELERASEALRRTNLRNLFGDDLDGIISLRLGDSKRHVYRAFKPGLVIDDNIKYLSEAREEGHKAVAFDRPWNNDWEHGCIFGWGDLDSILHLKEAV